MSIAYAPIGVTVRGATAYLRAACEQHWRATAEYIYLETGIRLEGRIIQARGGAAASAGTHSDGVAVDTRIWHLTAAQRRTVVRLLRECGWSATWDRAWPGNEHLHAVSDLVNTSGTRIATRASYQTVAVRAGFNGLGSGGRGGADDGPRPGTWRNSITGLAYARARIAALTAPKAPVPTPAPDPVRTRGILDMTARTTRGYSQPQTVQHGANPYLYTRSEKWWLLYGTPGPVVLTVHGYATAGKNSQLFIVAEHDENKTSRLLGRAPLPDGTGSFSGSATTVLEAGEVIRIQAVNHSGKAITIANITSTILHES